MAPLANQINANAIEAGGITLENTEALEQLFWKNIKNFPVTLTYIGTKDGEYYGSRRLADGSYVSSLANHSTKFLNERHIRNSKGQR